VAVVLSVHRRLGKILRGTKLEAYLGSACEHPKGDCTGHRLGLTDSFGTGSHDQRADVSTPAWAQDMIDETKNMFCMALKVGTVHCATPNLRSLCITSSLAAGCHMHTMTSFKDESFAHHTCLPWCMQLRVRKKHMSLFAGASRREHCSAAGTCSAG
jgi:hypothetical protein